MSVYVFLGPTLSETEAGAHLEAVYLPPVQQGDILRVLEERPRVIGIVDGLFRTVPSVWHKEILVALERGVHVFGAASMGALRAAELASFGMRGVGRVYERFADGTYEDDDEVAVAHAAAEHAYRELSVAMVNLRDALALAVDRGVLHRDEESALVDHAKATHYARRTFELLLGRAKTIMAEEKVERLARFFEGYGPSLKQRDTVEMLGAMRAFLATDPAPHQARVAVEQTLFLDALRAGTLERRPTRRVIDEAESMERVGVNLGALRREALIHILARSAAARHGLVVSEEDLAVARSRFRESAGLDDDEAEAAWLAREGMTKEALDSRLRDLVSLERVEESNTRRVDFELPDLAAVLGLLLGPRGRAHE